MKTIFLNILFLLVGITFVNGQDEKYVPDIDHENQKFVGIWSAKINGKTVKIYLESKTHTRFDSSSVYMDDIQGKYSVTDSNNKTLIAIGEKNNFLSSFVDRNSSNILNSSYLDYETHMVAQAKFEFNPQTNTLTLNLTDPQAGAIRLRFPGQKFTPRTFRIPTNIIFTKSK